MKANPHNTRIALVLAGFAAIPSNVSSAFAEKDRVATTEPPKSGDKAIAELLAQPIYNPLPGQMPVGTETVSRVSAVLSGLANTMEPGDQGQGSPWFTRLQTLRTGFTQLVASKLQSDLFAQVPVMAEFFAAEGDDKPEFVDKVNIPLYSLSAPILRSVAQHIAEQNAAVTPNHLLAFIDVFSMDGFISESNWEDQPIPVDAAGVMILDASAVVARLKTKPWKLARRFLGGETAPQAFSRYAASGNGLPALRTKYAANQSAIIAKWNELIGWVAQQSAENP